jgi:hypothetical protein
MVAPLLAAFFGVPVETVAYVVPAYHLRHTKHKCRPWSGLQSQEVFAIRATIFSVLIQRKTPRKNNRRAASNAHSALNLTEWHAIERRE